MQKSAIERLNITGTGSAIELFGARGQPNDRRGSAAGIRPTEYQKAGPGLFLKAR